MSKNYKRHQLLKLLADQHIKKEIGKANSLALGVPFEIIYKELKCNDYQLRELSAVLCENGEIGYQDAYGIKGLFAEEKGISAYSERKYIREHNKRLKDNIKDVVQIFIPTISLLIAYLAITTKVDNLANSNLEEIDGLKNNISLLNFKIDSLKRKKNIVIDRIYKITK